MKVAIYTRVSTKHEEQISSLENQKKHYEEFCDQNNYDSFKIYSDEGLSATSPNRKEYLEMLFDAGLDYEKDKDSNKVLYFKPSDRTPNFNLIITKDVSRFARNVNAIDLARILSVDKGVHVLFENAGFSTEDNDWELRLSLLLTFSQQESLDRSKKVAFAYKQRSKSGVYHMTKNLYGYRYDSETKKTSIVDEEAEVVRKMFDLYINHGYGVKNIANYLNENKIRTQNGNEWVAGNVRRLLRNEKYIGRVILNRYTNSGITSSNRKIKRPESEWIIHENMIPAIIDMDTWTKAQEVIEKRLDQTKEGSLTGSRKVKNIFYNKLFCAHCGKHYVRVVTTKKRKSGDEIKQTNYMCSNRRMRKSCDNTMISHNIVVEKITEFAKNELQNELNFKREMFTKIINMQKQLLNLKLNMSNKTIQAIKEQIAEIDIKIDKFTNALLDSEEIVKSVIRRKIKELEENRIELTEKLLENDAISLENEISQLNEFQLKLRTMVKSEYSFDEALQYLGKITADGRKLTFNVVADEKLEPLINIDVSRIGNSKLEALLIQLNQKVTDMRNEIKKK